MFCQSSEEQTVPSELSAVGAKRGVRSVPMRTVPSRRSTQAQPAEGRPGPSDDDDDDGDVDDEEEEDDDDDGRESMMTSKVELVAREGSQILLRQRDSQPNAALHCKLYIVKLCKNQVFRTRLKYKMQRQKA